MRRSWFHLSFFSGLVISVLFIGSCKDPDNLGAVSLTFSLSGSEDSVTEELTRLLENQPAKLEAFVHGEISPDVQQLSDGNYEINVKGNDGIKRPRVLMSKKMMQSDLLEALRNEGSPSYQAHIYQSLYQLLTDTSSEKEELTFPSPTVAAQLSIEQLIEFNQKIAQKIQSLQSNLPAQIFPYPTFAAPSCNAEEGVGRQTDGSTSCTHDAGSLFSRIDFPLKPYLNCVKDQGRRGTCVAFAVAGSAETEAVVKYNRYVNFSEQDLYLFAIFHTRPGQNYPDGLTASSTLLQTGGVPYRFFLEYGWDYNPSRSRTDTGSSYRDSCVGYAGFCSDTNHQARCVPIFLPSGEMRCSFFDPTSSGLTDLGPGPGWTIGTNAANHALAKTYLDAKFPVILSFLITSSFDSPSASGIMDYASGLATHGGHAAQVVGYIDNAKLPAGIAAGSGGGYFIIKNSWGCWADGGYVYMPYDYASTYGSSMTLPLLIKY